MDEGIELLFTVEESFRITGRGIVAVCRFEHRKAFVRAGDAVVLAMPDGRRVDARLRGIELICFVKPRDPMPIGLLFDRPEIDELLPIGTRIYGVPGS